MCYYRIRSVMDGRRLNLRHRGIKELLSGILIFCALFVNVYRHICVWEVDEIK